MQNSATEYKKEATLDPHLVHFVHRARHSAPVGRLIARWDRTIAVEVDEDDGAVFLLETRGGVLGNPRRVAGPVEAEIVVRGERQTLIDVFSGRLNPARAHLDGEIAVFGGQRDHLVLDSVVMLIWGY